MWMAWDNGLCSQGGLLLAEIEKRAGLGCAGQASDGALLHQEGRARAGFTSASISRLQEPDRVGA